MSISQRGALWVPFLATVAIFLFRSPDRLFDGYIWAEDTTVFLRSAYEAPWSSLFQFYAHYLNLIPRILTTALSVVAPGTAIPYVLPWICVLIFACSNTYVFTVARRYFAERGVGPTPLAALGVSLAPALIPHAGEVFLSVTNLQWVMTPSVCALIWECFYERRNEAPDRWIIVRAAAFALLSLTGPFALFLWPVAAVGFLFTGGWRNGKIAFVFGVYTAALTAQAVALLGPRPLPLQSLPWVTDFLTHMVAEVFVPRWITMTPGAAVATGTAMLTALLILSLATPARVICLALGAIGVTLWVAAMARVNIPELSFSWFGGGARYTYLPIFMVSWILIISAARARSHIVAFGASALLALMMLTSLSRFRSDHDFHWRIETTDGTTTLVAPPAPGWRVTIPAS